MFCCCGRVVIVRNKGIVVFGNIGELAPISASETIESNGESGNGSGQSSTKNNGKQTSGSGQRSRTKKGTRCNGQRAKKFIF